MHFRDSNLAAGDTIMRLLKLCVAVATTVIMQLTSGRYHSLYIMKYLPSYDLLKYVIHACYIMLKYMFLLLTSKVPTPTPTHPPIPPSFLLPYRISTREGTVTALLRLCTGILLRTERFQMLSDTNND